MLLRVVLTNVKHLFNDYLLTMNKCSFSIGLFIVCSVQMYKILHGVAFEFWWSDYINSSTFFSSGKTPFQGKGRSIVACWVRKYNVIYRFLPLDSPEVHPLVFCSEKNCVPLRTFWYWVESIQIGSPVNFKFGWYRRKDHVSRERCNWKSGLWKKKQIITADGGVKYTYTC